MAVESPAPARTPSPHAKNGESSAAPMRATVQTLTPVPCSLRLCQVGARRGLPHLCVSRQPDRTLLTPASSVVPLPARASTSTASRRAPRSSGTATATGVRGTSSSRTRTSSSVSPPSRLRALLTRSDGPPQVVGGAQGPGCRRLCPGVDLCCLDVLLRPLAVGALGG